MHRLSETKLYDPENGKIMWQWVWKSLPKLIEYDLNLQNNPQFGLPEEHFEKKTVFWDVFGGAMFERVYISMWWHRDFKKVNRASKQQKRTSTHPSSYIMHKSSAQVIRFNGSGGRPRSNLLLRNPNLFCFEPCTWSSTFKTSSEESRAWESWLETLHIQKLSSVTKGHKQTYYGMMCHWRLSKPLRIM